MQEIGKSRRWVRFDEFQLDCHTGELRKSDVQIAYLSGQPLRILLALLERPAELVTREELRRRLWPNDTVVEFEHSINTAIKRLRQMLGDSAENPQFIETLTRRGYRWIKPVEWVETHPGAAPAPPQSSDRSLLGKRVSHFRVLEILGGGGMGVVYKAEDIKLGRRVALKFLPEELANDAAAMERFEREARAASALNHPNICTIYAVDEYEGQAFIVMELLEGRTVRDAIADGSAFAVTENSTSPARGLVDAAIQIADGLDAAHKKGIIHRDIKPANLFITNHGQIKILDFGLAKLQEPDSPNGLTQPDSATLADQEENLNLALTRTGAAVGTAAYMSPEQVRREKLDARTDLFSFGLVLYEMATRQRAFEGNTALVLQKAILNHTPVPLRQLNSEIPTKLEEAITKAFEKNREERYQSAADIRTKLEAIRKEMTSKRLPLRIWFLTPVIVLLLTSAAIWLVRPLVPQSLPARDFKQHQLTANSSENPALGGAISPDGRYLVFTDLQGIHLKSLGTGKTQPIPQPEIYGDSPPEWQFDAWWPDSTRFLVVALKPQQPSGLWIGSVTGNRPVKIADNASPWGISPDGTEISITTRDDTELSTIDVRGELLRKVATARKGQTFRNARWSPDGRRIAYVKSETLSPAGKSVIETRDLQDSAPAVMVELSESTQLETAFQDFVWLPDGRVIYVMGEPDIRGFSCNLWQIRVDSLGRMIAKPQRLTNWAGFCVSDLGVTADGKQLSFVRSSDSKTVYVADFDAKKVNITPPIRLTLTDDLSSPTGWTWDSNAVFVRSNREGSWGIYRQPLTGEMAEPVVSGLRNLGWYAPLTPDHNWLLFETFDHSDSAAQTRTMRVSPSGGRAEEVARGNHETLCSQSPVRMCVVCETTPDGKQLVFRSLDPVKGKGGELARFIDDNVAEFAWDLSPDGTRVALYRQFANNFRLLDLTPPLTLRQIRVEGNAQLRTMSWAQNGKGLFASSAIQQGAELIHVDLKGRTHFLSQLRGQNAFLWAKPSPDGHRLAILEGAATANVWLLEDF